MGKKIIRGQTNFFACCQQSPGCVQSVCHTVYVCIQVHVLGLQVCVFALADRVNLPFQSVKPLSLARPCILASADGSQ